VNLPPVALPRTGGHRLLHLHTNTPGVLATVNSILADHGINIEGQLLATRGSLGYVVTDVGTPSSSAARRPARDAGDRAAARPAVSGLPLDELRAAVGAEHVLVDADLTRRTSATGRAASARAPGASSGRRHGAGVRRSCGPARRRRGAGRGAGRQHRARRRRRPAGGEVLLSLTRLTGLGDVDVAAGQVTAGRVSPGRPAEARPAAGLDFGVDLAARDSATVGGLVATNAGGIRVLRYGSMRGPAARGGGGARRRLGREPHGRGCSRTAPATTSCRCSPAARARSASSRAPAAARAAPDVALRGAARPARRRQRDRRAARPARRLPHLAAAELLFAEGLALVRKHGGLPAPFAEDHPAYLLLECADTSDPTDDLVEAVSEAEGLLDANVATDAAGQRRCGPTASSTPRRSTPRACR
jgi:hypothetical protein